MRIGMIVTEHGLTADDLLDQAHQIAAAGIGGAWMGQVYGWDTLTALAAIGGRIPHLELATVVPTYAQHPLKLASQALSVQALVGDRLTLAVGASHRDIAEGRYGQRYERVAQHTREYLSVLGPALRGETVSYEGEQVRAGGSVSIGGARPPALLLAAHGPLMLRLAGRLTDGVVVGWAGPKTLAEHVVPNLVAGADAGGRPRPRVAVQLFLQVTDDPGAARAEFVGEWPMAGRAPAYLSMIEREGKAGPEDLIAVGDEKSVRRQLESLREAGAGEFVFVPFGSAAARRRTIDFVGALARESD